MGSAILQRKKNYQSLHIYIHILLLAGIPRRVFNLTRRSYHSEVEEFCAYAQGWEGIATMAHISGFEDGVWNARSQNGSSLSTEFEVITGLVYFKKRKYPLAFRKFLSANTL